MTILLHGFWGQPKDWNEVLKRLPLGHSVLVPDLFAPGPLTPCSLRKWVGNFWAWVDHHVGTGTIELVGYSLGGRLAVAAALACTKRVNRALFLSTNPLAPLEAPADRALWEENWVQSFRTASWPDLKRTWQEQAVFGQTTVLERREGEELRELLALGLTEWSALRHPFTGADIRQLEIPATWAFGALDQKYLQVAKNLQELPVKGQITIIPEAGHRLVADAPGFISEWMGR